MKIYSRRTIQFSSIFMFLMIGGCSPSEPDQGAQMANPASEYCLKIGGKLEIIEDAAGEKGMCHLPDGTVMEEWELFRRDDPQGRM